jgi:hypothetical protein
MPDANTHVGLIARLDQPSQAAVGEATVHLQGGGSYQLDPADPKSAGWAVILSELHQAGEPVYLDVDPQTNQVRRLLLPQLLRVTAVAPQPAGGRVEVELFPSHAVNYVRVAHPSAQQILNDLRAAQQHGTPVLVTRSTRGPEIVDVRPPPAPLNRGLAAVAAVPPAPHDCPLTAAAAISSQRARQLFDLVSGLSCQPASPAADCLPFLYPDDGCWARAHQMSRLMSDDGATPCKAWLYGRLSVDTRNNPDCRVAWHYHVAPVVLVDTYGRVAYQVIDPALFDAPVEEASWVAVQNDPGARLVRTDAAVYIRSSAGAIAFDPGFSETARWLAVYRRELRDRALTEGPPPYSHCP